MRLLLERLFGKNDSETYVYLAGAIFGQDDSCVTWREEAKKLLQCKTKNPLDRDYRGIETGHYQEIVEDDLEDIRNSKIVLVRIKEPSWGTAMEIVYATNMQKHIVAWGKTDNISPWLRYHCHELHNKLVDACNSINRRL